MVFVLVLALVLAGERFAVRNSGALSCVEGKSFLSITSDITTDKSSNCFSN